MKTISINDKVKDVSVIGIGCMRINGLQDEKAVRDLAETALDSGINFFDHADIYGGGECEEIFGRAIPSSLRERMILQTKCVIRPGVCYDSSKEYILQQVDASLRRLHTEYVDILLLHRPDALMEPEEIAEAFDTLEREGKVRAFGVSNHNPMQIELLNAYCGGRIKVNQIQYSIAHCPTIDAGLNFNIANDAGCSRDNSIIEYARWKKLQLQAWSPFQYGMFEGTFLGNERYRELNAVIDRLAEQYHTTPNAIAVAWILRHPAKIQCIVGTTNRKRIEGLSAAADITLTREEWYELYLAAGKQLP